MQSQRRTTHGAAHLAIAITLGLLIALAGVIVTPAHACACGAAEPRDDATELGIHSEQAVVVHDGEREQLAISLGLSTNSPELAFLMPVPAKAEVTLADDKLFDQLEEHTEPEIKYEYKYFDFSGGEAGAPPPAGGTQGPKILGRQKVGQYDVVQLTGSQQDVGDWLNREGFRTRNEVLAILGDYLDDDWVVMAVKLAFEPNESFAGDLEPLLLDFPSTELVYPMKLSALLDGRQTVGLHVFAQHRMQAHIDDIGLPVTYAGAESAATLKEQAPAAAELLGDRELWLTSFETTLGPGEVDADVTFSLAAEGDQPHREVIVRVRDRTDTTKGIAILAAIVGVSFAAGWLGHLLVARHRAKKGAVKHPTKEAEKEAD